ncbi:MAG: OsmC family protein [Candidatus Hydrothermales bacterium]
MKVTLENIKGLKFKGKNERGHEIYLDTKIDLGGFDSAPTPMETLLIALGGCTGMDVVSILSKMRVNFSYFGIEIEGKRKDEHPKVFEKIHIKYLFGGENLPMEKLEKAIELSLSKYCSVSNMLKGTAEITYSIEIVPTQK